MKNKNTNNMICIKIKAIQFVYSLNKIPNIYEITAITIGLFIYSFHNSPH